MHRRTFFLAADHAEPEAVITEICLAADAMAAAVDLQFSYVGSQRRANGATMHKIVDVLNNFADVDLVVDDSLPSPYLVVTAATEAIGAEIVKTLRENLSMLATAQLLEHAAAAERTPGALIALGMGMNGATAPDAERLLIDGLKSPDAEIRYGAAVGASFLRSSVLASAIRSAAEAEQEQDLARVMTAVHGIITRVD
jgi:hypothetical protein